MRARELQLDLDKREQTSDWTQRPLSDRQVAYAALDAEVMLQLVERFAGLRTKWVWGKIDRES